MMPVSESDTTLESLTATTDKCRNTSRMFQMAVAHIEIVADVWGKQPCELYMRIHERKCPGERAGAALRLRHARHTTHAKFSTNYSSRVWHHNAALNIADVCC